MRICVARPSRRRDVSRTSSKRVDIYTLFHGRITCRVAATIARQFEPLRRLNALTWSRVLAELRDNGHNVPALQTCQAAAVVARQFQTFRRIKVLSWSHHQAVAVLDEREQDWLLER